MFQEVGEHFWGKVCRPRLGGQIVGERSRGGDVHEYAWRSRLADHIRLQISARFVELACERCDWLDVLIREKITPEQIIRIAQTHRCATTQGR